MKKYLNSIKFIFILLTCIAFAADQTCWATNARAPNTRQKLETSSSQIDGFHVITNPKLLRKFKTTFSHAHTVAELIELLQIKVRDRNFLLRKVREAGLTNTYAHISYSKGLLHIDGHKFLFAIDNLGIEVILHRQREAVYLPWLSLRENFNNIARDLGARDQKSASLNQIFLNLLTPRARATSGDLLFTMFLVWVGTAVVMWAYSRADSKRQSGLEKVHATKGAQKYVTDELMNLHCPAKVDGKIVADMAVPLPKPGIQEALYKRCMKDHWKWLSNKLMHFSDPSYFQNKVNIICRNKSIQQSARLKILAIPYRLTISKDGKVKVEPAPVCKSKDLQTASWNRVVSHMPNHQTIKDVGLYFRKVCPLLSRMANPLSNVEVKNQSALGKKVAVFKEHYCHPIEKSVRDLTSKPASVQ